MCKLSTCCLFLLIQFFWHVCFCWKIFNVYAQAKHPESSPENSGVCSNIVPPLNRSPSLEHVVPWHIFNGTGPVWLLSSQLATLYQLEKNELQAPEMFERRQRFKQQSPHLVDLFWSWISHQQSSSYMNYPKTIPTVSLPQGYDDVTRPCSVRWAGLGEGISHPAVKALIQSHWDRMAFVG